jgi:hypothetical protein
MAIIKLKGAVKESWLKNEQEQEPIQLTTEEKRDFLNKISEYNKFGKAIYNENDLVEIAQQLSEIAQIAETMALAETNEAFDGITVKRNMKELKNLTGQFGKVATEAQSLNQRLTGLYEDLGGILNRYYDIKELNELGDNKSDDGTGGVITAKTKEKSVPTLIKKKRES